MSDSDIFAQSRAAFAAHFPKIAARLERGKAAESSVMFENGEPVDIEIAGRRIYGGDARRFAAEEVAAFLKKPLRFFVQRLDLSGIVTDVGRRLIRKIEEGLRENRFGQCTSNPTRNPTFLVVFGLGLGHHLEELARETEARWLIIVEPLPEFFEPSCHVVDWGPLVESFKNKGGAVHIITESDPDRMTSAVCGFMSSKGVPYADGSWVFTHYPFWAFTEARNKLHEAVEFNFINRGFYEDELVMMRNAVENFATNDFLLLEDRPYLRRSEIAVMAGAGPSLDESIETLQRIRDQIVLFSAGTALRPLLRNGLVPDFHCELENGTQVYDVLTEASKFGDLSQITLLAAGTVDPRVPRLFGKTILYFRDTVSSTEILHGKHRPIYGTGPTCVNMGLVTASVMGFRNFIFFGTDCGIRPGSGRHAKGTVYTDIDFYRGGQVTNNIMQVEGNFGGVVNTEIVYNACRLMMIDTVRYYGLDAINCSDGALIPGARPCVPEALEIPCPPFDRGAFMEHLERSLKHYAPGQLLEEANIDSIRRHTEEMFADLDKLLAELGEGEADFAVAYDRVMAFVAEAKNRYLRTESMISGSLQALPRIAMFYGFRVAEDAGRRVLFDAFIAEFRAIAEFMAENIHALFDNLATYAPAPSERVAVSAD